MPTYIGNKKLKSCYIGDKKVKKIYIGNNLAYNSENGVEFDPILNNNTWEQIANAYALGIAQDLWKVGDRKSVHIEGTIGTLYVNDDFDAVIIGFDHNAKIEGYGITFQLFWKDDIPLALVDSMYNSNSFSGSHYFNMNHWGNYNYGGWAACDMRYDILGSTDVAPENYGEAKTSGATGYNPTENCTKNPVTNSLMAALPYDLRAVMKPITKYSDNVGGGTNRASNIKTTIDYLPLPSEAEIFGGATAANAFEGNYTVRYAYYSAMNSRVKYRHDMPATSAYWWERSVSGRVNAYFCRVGVSSTSGGANSYSGSASCGIAPIFLV